MLDWRFLLSWVTVACALLAFGCGPGGNGDEPEILDPEPAGAPTALAAGRLTCLGNNLPDPPGLTNITLPGWARALADPANTGGTTPTATADIFDADGTMLGQGFADTSNGRISVVVPVTDAGFTGYATVSADTFVTTSLFTSRPYTDTNTAAWVWLPTMTEVTDHATMAGETLDPSRGIIVGAVHDCVVFGVANAVIRWGTSIDGIVYYDTFTPSTSATFTSASGRFAIPNVPPGPITVDAFGRIEAGGPLVLLSRATVQVTAGQITAVDLQPRVGLDR